MTPARRCVTVGARTGLVCLWMNPAQPHADLPSSGMGEVRLDATGVRAVAQRILDGADVLDGIRWPTAASEELADSAIERATAAPDLENRVADVVAGMRAWAAAALSAAAGVQEADERHAGRLGQPR